MAGYSNGFLGKLGIVKSPGAPVPHRKHTTDCETVDMPVPATVSICMQQHIGAPCVPVVKAGDQVFVGQLIGDSDKYVSAPIHSSVSGKVVKIDTLLMPSGASAQTVVIETDGKQTPDPGIKPPVVNNREDLIKAVRDSGLVGLGGAGFPTHVKLNPSSESKIDTLIINGAECEPYITSDVRKLLKIPGTFCPASTQSASCLALKWLILPLRTISRKRYALWKISRQRMMPTVI